MRIKYYDGTKLSTIIDVDYRTQKVSIKNYTDDMVSRAFGVLEHPTIKDLEYFLESRCFPRTRDKLRWHLEELGIDCYDPMLIVKKTQGRMADDDMWMEFEE